MLTATQERVAKRMISLVREKQDKLRPEQILSIIKCNRSNTQQVFDNLIKQNELRITRYGFVIARAAQVSYDSTQLELTCNL